MVDMYSLLVMYGGTFDPVHYGHLKSVETLANLIDLRRLIVVPNNIPPHRQQPTANSTQRNHMLELAIFNNPLFVLDKRELRREIPSYTSQTLQEWRREVGITRPLAFIIGQDSLLSFPFWHQYKTILDNVHLIVCRRPGYPLVMKEKQHQRLINAHLTDNPDDLRSLSAGKIYLAETPWFDISSTLIRQRLQNKLPCDNLLPASVLEYINQQELYQKHTE